MRQLIFANPGAQQAYANDPANLYAQGLMQQGASTAPVHSWGEGLARALQGGLGGYAQRKTNQRYQDQDTSYRASLAAALKGDDPLAALQNSQDPNLQSMALDARLKQQLNPEADPLVKVYDPAIKAERYMKQSEARGLQASAPTEAKPPQTRQIHRGGQIIDQQFDPSTGGFTDVGSGPAFAPREPGRTYQDIKDKDGNVIGQVDDRGHKDMFSNGITISPDGTVQIGGAGGKLTESQGAATAYGKRMWDAESRISSLVGANPTDFSQSVVGSIPLVGNYMLTAPYQQYKQASTDWIRAKLRKESGATISPSELDSDFQTFFPQPGDKPEVVAQKADARKSAFEGMIFQAGAGKGELGAAAQYPSVPAVDATRTKDDTLPSGAKVRRYDSQGNRIP